MVRDRFRRVKPLKEIPVPQRGWTLDVLTAIRSLKAPTFSTRDAYELVPHLEALHPGNRYVREKIRQQLQVLRDTGFLVHPSRGTWSLRSPDLPN